MKEYIIIPGCCDLNRGDQALGWETARIAQDAGFKGQYAILAERAEPVEQSIQEGYKIIVPALEHPSRKFENKDNIVYNKRTKIMWGVVAAKDFFHSLFILKRKWYRQYTITRSKDSKYVETLKFFQNADAVFMKGGGLIQSHGGLISTYATYYRLYHIFLAHSLQKPVYILPNSFGPFEGPFVKFMVKRAFQECKFISARERKTQEVVKAELGMKIPCYPDLAFYLENGTITKQDLLDRFAVPSDKKIVAITMRPYRFPDKKDPETAYKVFQDEMRKFICWLAEHGYMPFIVEHTFAITSHENDGDCIKDVINGLDENIYRLLSDRSMNCRQLKSVYGSCDYIIGTRFHSLIFSLSNMVPGIAISYDGYKSVGIMRDMGLGEYVLDINDVTAQELENKFESLTAHEKEIKNDIKKYIQFANNERNQLIKELEQE